MNDANRFEVLRNYWRLSQVDMAAQLGVSRRTLQRYEQGEPPTGEAMAALAKLGVNLNWLLTGQGSMMVDGANAVASMELEPLQSDSEAGRMAELENRIAVLEKELADQRSKNDQWIAGAKNLLAGCMLAVDQMEKEQRVVIPPKQRANMVTSMFIEMASLTDEEIHTMMGGNKNKGQFRR